MFLNRERSANATIKLCLFFPHKLQGGRQAVNMKVYGVRVKTVSGRGARGVSAARATMFVVGNRICFGPAGGEKDPKDSGSERGWGPEQLQWRYGGEQSKSTCRKEKSSEEGHLSAGSWRKGTSSERPEG